MTFGRAMLRVFIQTLFRQTKEFDMDGDVAFARLPEIGLIGCPMRFTT